MALAEDRRALLRLLLDGDTYDELVGLTGTSASEVRSRAYESVAELELEGEGELAAAARRRLADLDGSPSEAAAESVGQSSNRTSGRRWWAFAWVPAVVLTVGVAAFLVVRQDGASTVTSADSGQGEANGARITLKPVDGSRATGIATLTSVADLPVLDFDMRGLEPSGAGQTYVVWLLATGRGLPIAFRAVGADGRFEGRTNIPAEATALLASIETVELTLASEDKASRAVQAAARQGTLPPRVGRPVLRGGLRR